MDFELISFKLCPFVQRAVITLLHKDIPHHTTFIDLQNRPDWFMEISPLGKVPVLRVDGTVLFESAVIAEYLDDVTPGRLLPEDPLERALSRAWIELGSAALGEFYGLYTASDEESFKQASANMVRYLGQLERILGHGPYFRGSDFSLVDCAFAPFFMRLELLNRRHPLIPAGQFPKADAWSAALLALPSVQKSVVDNFETLFYGQIQKLGGWGAHLFAE